MISKSSLLALAILLALPPRGDAAAEYPSGPRPQTSVFDPSGFLKPQRLKEISDPLAVIFKDEGVDVIVVILRELGGESPELVAQRFARAWSPSSIHCIVLHVPGSKDSPWIFPSGEGVRLLDPDRVRQAIKHAQRRASLQKDESENVRTAALEATDMLREWKAAAAPLAQSLTPSAQTHRRLETKWAQWRTAALLAAASIIPFVIGYGLQFVYRRNREPVRFSSPPMQARLGAPYAGGDHLVVPLGPQIP